LRSPLLRCWYTLFPLQFACRHRAEQHEDTIASLRLSADTSSK
jgi:hypothetical protein